MTLRSRGCLVLLAACLAVCLIGTGCNTGNANRIPTFNVHLTFNTIGDWNLYGVRAATDTRRFIIGQKIPAGFPYPGTSATGYGGLLLVAQYTYSGDPAVAPPVCYDLSCPVEALPDVRVSVDQDLMRARCPRCGSTYDIFNGYGIPLSGPAAEDGYSLRRYRVSTGSFPYVIISL